MFTAISRGDRKLNDLLIDLRQIEDVKRLEVIACGDMATTGKFAKMLEPQTRIVEIDTESEEDAVRAELTIFDIETNSYYDFIAIEDIDSSMGQFLINGEYGVFTVLLMVVNETDEDAVIYLTTTN